MIKSDYLRVLFASKAFHNFFCRRTFQLWLFVLMVCQVFQAILKRSICILFECFLSKAKRQSNISSIRKLQYYHYWKAAISGLNLDVTSLIINKQFQDWLSLKDTICFFFAYIDGECSTCTALTSRLLAVDFFWARLKSWMTLALGQLSIYVLGFA